MNDQGAENVFGLREDNDTSSLYARIHAHSVLQGRAVSPRDSFRLSPILPEDVEGAYRSAYSFLLEGLRLSYQVEASEETDSVLRRAGEFLEQLYQHDVTRQDERTRELYNAAVAYYLAGYYARAYVIVKELKDSASSPRDALDLLRLFFIKQLSTLEESTFRLLVDPDHTDQRIRRALENGDIDQAEALVRILSATLARALHLFAQHPRRGQSALIKQAISLADLGSHVALEQMLTSWWWVFYSTAALLREYRTNSLWQQLECMLEEDTSGLVSTYIRTAAVRDKPMIELWRSQTVALPRINNSERA